MLNLNGFREYFGQMIHSELVSEASQISFRIPGTKEEIQYETNESFYHCIIELLSPQDLINILKGILLEKSFIFVGEEHLTS